MRRITTSQAATVQGAALLPRLEGVLPNDLPDEELPEHPPCVRQTISLFDLPPELRNRLYSTILPSRDRGDQPLIATPFWDSLMLPGTQPPITRASRQTRSESLAMFYTNNDLHAYISHSDFRQLFRWTHCIFTTSTSTSITTSTTICEQTIPIPTPIRVHLRLSMLHKLTCHEGLALFAKEWYRAQPRNVHVTIRSAFSSPQQPGKRQCEALAAAINVAERKGVFEDESELVRQLFGSLGGVFSWACFCDVLVPGDHQLLLNDDVELDQRLCSRNCQT